MKITHIALAVVGLFIASKVIARVQANNVIGATDQYRDGSNWYEDAWARLNGRDLSLDGSNPLPNGYDAHGVDNEMGWNYDWDGTLRGGRLGPAETLASLGM